MDPPSSRPQRSYDVFLSFRGEDTRRTFTDDLYRALTAAGFYTFRDDDEIERGENINSELVKAIHQSRGSIVVISKNYADSRWCLDELAMILDHRRAKGHAVLPIFYYVDPSRVRNQTGSFGRALAAHEKRFEAEYDEGNGEWMEKMQKWRKALREVADLGGMVFNKQSDGCESKFIRKVTRVIEDKVNRAILSIAPYLVGIDSRVWRINRWLQNNSPDAGIVAISGMSGIGKTTIAKYVFSLNHERFEISSFLANIRELCEKPNGLIRLQKQFLSDVMKGRKIKIRNIDEGISWIKDVTCGKRVLVVLDDVDHIDQLHAILGIRDWLCIGSKIIITTKQVQILKAAEFHKIHHVEQLYFSESLELFSWHAFGQDHPDEDYMDHSKRVAKHCGGLPLALRVLGSSLHGKSLDVWKSAIDKLEVIPANQFLEKLKISYHSLQDDHDRNLFLEISCFFIGMEKDYVVSLLDECDFYTGIGIQNLTDRSLLTIVNNKLTMHQLLRDMGREIIRQESPKEPGKRSRLWRHKDSFSVLTEKTGTATIEGLVLDMNMLKEDKSAMAVMDAGNTKRRRSEGIFDKSMLSELGNSLKRRRFGFFAWLPGSAEFYFETDAFETMDRLRLLQLNYAQLVGGYKEFPKKLRCLNWRGFPLKSIPRDFPLGSIVAIDMRNSSLEGLWEGTRFLLTLKILNLSHSYGLRRTPDFSELPHLEKLLLKDCIGLVEVHESIGKLETRLLVLNLRGCKSLRKLPRDICKLKVLETLIISGCSNLEELPMELRGMESLKVFRADGIAIRTSAALSPATQDDTSWHGFIWSLVSKPRKIPQLSWTSLPRSLVMVSLAGCNLSTDAFPVDFNNLPLLQNLILDRNPICSLPNCIKSLPGLQVLELYSCTELQELTGLPKIRDLRTGNCTILEKITYQSASCIAQVNHVNDCPKLVDMEGSFKLEPVGKIDGGMKNSLGLYVTDSLGSSKVKLYNNHTGTEKEGPIQVFSERGLISIFLPGNKVPDWFSYKSAGSSVSFVVPSHHNLQIQGLNVCTVYAIDKTSWIPGVQLYTIISNQTKDLKLIYGPGCYGLSRANDENIMWWCHWQVHNQFEAGDELNVSLLTMPGFDVKEVGVQVVYEEQDQMGNQSVFQELVQQRRTDLSLHIIPGNEARYRGNTRFYCFGHLGVSPEYLLQYIP